VYLSRLSLTDYRNYAAAEVTLGPGPTTIIGANGQGKTNFIEAAAYLATLGSHRVATDAPLIRQGAERAVVRGVVTAAGRDNLLEVEINPGRANRLRVNRAAARPREALGILRCVLFAPEDIAIVKGDPDQRRRYLDDLLVSMRPRYAGVRADYERVLRQRTALLKSAKARGAVPPGALDVWDDQLVSAGAVLTTGRLRLVAAIRPLLASCYSAVSGAARDTDMRYRMAAAPAVSTGDGSDEHAAGEPIDSSSAGETEPDQEKIALALRDALAARRRAELERGVCLVGPHRDELELRIGGLPSRGYASHGESWSLALALRLAAYQLLSGDGASGDPVLLLDDVFAELDTGRRDRLAALVAGAEQVLVTAAVPEDVPDGLAGARLQVASGVIASG
jgi:DNA replication and repair protein RecF